LINRLFEVVVSGHKPNDLKSDKISNDPSNLSIGQAASSLQK
jgi:hypothetical protein